MMGTAAAVLGAAGTQRSQVATLSALLVQPSTCPWGQKPWLLDILLCQGGWYVPYEWVRAPTNREPIIAPPPLGRGYIGAGHQLSHILWPPHNSPSCGTRGLAQSCPCGAAAPAATTHHWHSGGTESMFRAKLFACGPEQAIHACVFAQSNAECHRVNTAGRLYWLPQAQNQCRLGGTRINKN